MLNLEGYLNLVDIVNQHAKSYYVDNEPEVDDFVYDEMIKQIKQFENNNPHLISKDSPTQKVGGLSSSFNTIKHIKRLYSLDNVFSKDELKEWMQNIVDKVGKCSFTIMHKYDGLSLSLRYKNGELLSASTRGDGIIGEDVTLNALNIIGVSRKIPYKGEIEIRGEVVMTLDAYEELNKERAAKGEKLFSNPRNAAAGSLRQKDPNITKERKLRFFPWGIGYADEDFKEENKYSLFSIVNKLSLMLTMGKVDNDPINNNYKHMFPIGMANYVDKEHYEAMNEYGRSTVNFNSCSDFIDKTIKIRDQMRYMVDGLVVMVDNINLQENIGYNIKAPKFGIALKLPAIERETKLRDITWQVGRTGIVTPVGELEPVDIDGVKVSRCTLHNYNEILRLGLKIGDTIRIIRSGDVIPKILSFNIDKRTGEEIDILPPKYCPSCKEQLTTTETGTIFCDNENCQSIVVNKLIHFVSRPCMDIKGLGESRINMLCRNNIINKLSDLYDLVDKDYDYINNMIHTDRPLTQNEIDTMKKSILKTTGVKLSKFIHGLGIENIGYKASSEIEKYFGLDFVNKTQEDFLKIREIGEKAALSISNYLLKNKDMVMKLIEQFKPKPTDYSSNRKLSGYNICITGEFSDRGLTRNDISNMIIENSGVNDMDVYKGSTTHLLVGSKPGSKLAKAEKYGVKLMNIDEFLNLIKE